MCGIAGICGQPASELAPLLATMGEYLAHRGPDGNGTWIDERNSLGFAHRRLAVVDLSPSGAQPITSASGRLVLNYNGEIYNHRELRSELERQDAAPSWHGHSDTEVLLACLEAWGVEATLAKLNGMFSLALWDSQRRVLSLARDRMGEKPLYFGWVAGRFVFASELKALLQLPGSTPRMDPEAISSYLAAGYVRGPRSAVTGIFRLPPGCSLTLTPEQMNRPQAWDELRPRVHEYWSLEMVAIAGMNSPILDPGQATDSLEALLLDAVESRMGADVPLGAFLSGGIDSSLVIALMQARATRPVRTFSIGFDDPALDEAEHARAVAAHVGTEHSEFRIDSADVLRLVPRLATTFDEPFADHSQLPTMLLAEMTREKVTVALSGDGGDELFAGYGRYRAIVRWSRLLDSLPASVRNRLPGALGRFAAALGRLPRGAGAGHGFAQRLERLAERLDVENPDALRLSFLGGAGVSRIQRSGMRRDCRHGSPPPAMQDPVRRLLYGDQADYLPDDILHKLDRASMAHGLEARVPLLDHRVVEFSWRLPTSMLVSGNVGKLPLRHVLARYVPKALIDRPKQGFDPPLGAWLRGPLREWADELLNRRALQELPMVDAEGVRKLWAAHCDGRRDAGNALWNVLMLSDWRKQVGAVS